MQDTHAKKLAAFWHANPPKSAWPDVTFFQHSKCRCISALSEGFVHPQVAVALVIHLVPFIQSVGKVEWVWPVENKNVSKLVIACEHLAGSDL